MRHYNECFNELTIIQIIITVTLLTDYVPSASVRYDVGILLIYMIIVQTAVNTLFLMIDL